MTPEEIEQLARKCASAVAKVEGPSSYYERLLPVLTTHLAAREEEYARLRKAAERCVKEVKKEIVTPPELGFAVLQTPPCIEALKDALTPQQEQGNER